MTLEKSKGPTIEKVKTIQLTQADLQLLMRTCAEGRNVENNARLSKFNSRSRSNYSTQTAILEERLMCDLAARERSIMMHKVPDLKACCDSQLCNIGHMTQEEVRVY